MVKLSCLALVAALLPLSACGSGTNSNRHRVAVGAAIDSYGALPCKLESSSPEGVVKAEVIKASLMGKAEGVDATTVRLVASAPATASVSCKGSTHQVEFSEAKKIAITNVPASKIAVGTTLRLEVSAYNAKGEPLQIDHLVSDELMWTLEGPVEHAAGDAHPTMAAAGANTTPVKLNGKGTVGIVALWRGLKAESGFVVK